jgi:hypothetical protein
MCSTSRQRIFLGGLFALYGFAALHRAWAEPPLVKFAVTVSHESALDLRPPPEIQTGDPIARSESQAVAPSRRSFALEAFASGSRLRSDSRAFTVGQSTPPMSPLEDVAHDFRRQGLPVAKLFQNGSLLVHLGLSPRGKPGLWFVHALH